MHQTLKSKEYSFPAIGLPSSAKKGLKNENNMQIADEQYDGWHNEEHNEEPINLDLVQYMDEVKVIASLADVVDGHPIKP